MTKTMHQADGQLEKLTMWARKNNIGVTSAYKLANSGALRVVKVGNSTYVRREDSDAFMASLPAYAPRALAARKTHRAA